MMINGPDIVKFMSRNRASPGGIGQGTEEQTRLARLAAVEAVFDKCDLLGLEVEGIANSIDDDIADIKKTMTEMAERLHEMEKRIGKVIRNVVTEEMVTNLSKKVEDARSVCSSQCGKAHSIRREYLACVSELDGVKKMQDEGFSTGCSASLGVTQQRGYECYTCMINGKRMKVCSECASICHKGHNLSQIVDIQECECGSRKFCSCRLMPPVCTRKIHGTAPRPQLAYKCKTCNSDLICETCSRICHAEHEIAVVRNGPPFVCACKLCSKRD